jgi:hypothetical protein
MLLLNPKKIQIPDGADREVLVLTSGGMDSAACLRFFMDFGRPPQALFINYGQKSGDKEHSAARLVCDYFGVPLQVFNAPFPEIPGPGFVTGRNLFLASAALILKKQVSSPGESHPQALSEPDVNLSTHPAPIIQPQAQPPSASGQRAGGRVSRFSPASIRPCADGG